jgi:hypothetical protein
LASISRRLNASIPAVARPAATASSTTRGHRGEGLEGHVGRMLEGREVVGQRREVEQLSERAGEHPVQGDRPDEPDARWPHPEQQRGDTEHDVHRWNVVEVRERQVGDVSPLARDDGRAGSGCQAGDRQDHGRGARDHGEVRSEPGRAAEGRGQQRLASALDLLRAHAVQRHDHVGGANSAMNIAM